MRHIACTAFYNFDAVHPEIVRELAERSLPEFSVESQPMIRIE